MSAEGHTSTRILLAPMEGLLDCRLRDVLTRVGGVDRCVSEFIRITGTLLPNRAFVRVMPELENGGRTFAACRCAGNCSVRTQIATQKTPHGWPNLARPVWI